MFENIFAGLNERQTEAVTATEGYVRIIAGAGSGKTRALACRYAYLVRAAGVHPGSVLCVTFTNKAASEMKRRVRSLAGDGYDTSLITTYHGFCVRVLREHIGRLFYPDNFIILDTADQKAILEEIYTEFELKLDHASFERIIGLIDKKKATEAYVHTLISRTPSAVPESGSTDDRIIARYLQRQKQIFGLDFNDLINFVFVLFDSFPDIRRMWQQRLEYIQVDEFQDSSTRELRLINILSELKGNLFVVGDPDQNIYEWRGAKVEILVDFDRSHPGTQTVVMDRNYRSTARILKAANTLIAFNQNRIKKDLFTEDGDGEEVIHMHAATEADESRYIASTIAELKKKGVDYRSVAVLYRSGFLSRSVEQALMEADIPYEIIGSTKFFRRMEVMDALAYLKLVSSDDDIALLRIINTPRRMFGKAKVARLKALAAEAELPLYETLRLHRSLPEFARSKAGDLIDTIESIRYAAASATVSELLDRVLTETGYEAYIRESGGMERLENLAELKKIALEQERGWGEALPLSEFLRQIALMSDYDAGEKADRVKLMTIHAAKGLEFPVCFVVGMTDGIMPSSRTIEERGQAGLEEERRLCFVALTRAMRRLYLTDSEGVNRSDGGSEYRKLPSRFLFEIGEQNYRRIGEIPEELAQRARSRPSVLTAKPKRLPAGERVSHVIFGPGVIESINEERGLYNIRFDKTGQVKPISTDYDFGAWNSIADTLAVKREQARLEREQRKTVPLANIKEESDSKNETKDEAADSPNEPANESFKSFESSESSESSESFESADEHKNERAEEPPDEPVYEPYEPEAEHPDDFADEHENESGQEEPSAAETQTPPKPEETDNLWKRGDVPHSGWECTGISDLGAPTGICGMCGRQIIRYVHHMRHTAYPRSVGAGCVCAGRMEGDTERSAKRESSFKNREARRRSFMGRTRKRSKNGNEYIKYKNEIVTILPDKFKKGCFKAAYKGSFTLSSPTPDGALSAAFDLIDRPTD
ncbi:MAG: 3'-5' exonuclease [Eubacteriales bacterium]|nr:3'-5' exonuclease [Eubacteriales bacterium]